MGPVGLRRGMQEGGGGKPQEGARPMTETRKAFEERLARRN